VSWFQRCVPAWAAALAGYGLAAILLFWPAWLSPAERTVGGRGDPFFFMWFLRWFPYAVAHGWNPLFTTHLDYPDGVNLMWNTSIALPSLLLTPVTLIAGPIVAYNLLVTMGLAVSGWCAYLALRRYVRSGAAAFVGGAIYAFSPFMVSQSLGHPHLTMAWAPPLVLLILDEVLVRQRVSRWHGVLLGGLGAAQLVTGEELLAMVTVAGVIGVVILAVLHRDAVRSRLRPALPVFGTALGTFLLLAGLPLAVQFLGPQQVHGPLQPHNYYVADVLNFVVPTRMQLAAPGLATHLSDHFTGNVAEQTAYLGVPLLALLVVFVRRRWGQPVVAWAVITGVVIAILSLGTTMHVAGSDTGIPLPWALLDRVPLVREILPARLSLVVYLLVGLLVAVFLDAALARPGWRPRIGGTAVTALALAALIPSLPYPTSSVTTPTFFSRPLALRTLPEGGVVLVAPFAVVGSADAMYWQAAAAMWFRMPEGEAFVPGPYPLYPPRSATELALVPLAYGADPPAAVDTQVAMQIRADLRRWNVEAVVVGPMLHQDQAVALITTVLGQRPVQDGGVDVWWNVSAALAQADK
jgi:hypothetical protein